MSESFSDNFSRKKERGISNLSSEEIKNMSFSHELLDDPIEKLKEIRSGLLNQELSENEVIDNFIEALEMVVKALRDNKYNFFGNLPQEFETLVNAQKVTDEATRSVFLICKECGCKKEGLRSWIIRSFNDANEDENAIKRKENMLKQKRELDLLEEVYGE